LIAAHVPNDRTSLDRAVAECAVDGIARRLTASEIAEIDRFMSTPTRQRFWDAARFSMDSLLRCYKEVLQLQASVSDYLAVGLKPPKEPDAPPPRDFLS
jgi:hypothetical protein